MSSVFFVLTDDQKARIARAKAEYPGSVKVTGGVDLICSWALATDEEKSVLEQSVRNGVMDKMAAVDIKERHPMFRVFTTTCLAGSLRGARNRGAIIEKRVGVDVRGSTTELNEHDTTAAAASKRQQTSEDSTVSKKQCTGNTCMVLFTKFVLSIVDKPSFLDICWNALEMYLSLNDLDLSEENMEKVLFTPRKSCGRLSLFPNNKVMKVKYCRYLKEAESGVHNAASVRKAKKQLSFETFKRHYVTAFVSCTTDLKTAGVVSSILQLRGFLNVRFPQCSNNKSLDRLTTWAVKNADLLDRSSTWAEKELVSRRLQGSSEEDDDDKSGYENDDDEKEEEEDASGSENDDDEEEEEEEEDASGSEKGDDNDEEEEQEGLEEEEADQDEVEGTGEKKRKQKVIVPQWKAHEAAEKQKQEEAKQREQEQAVVREKRLENRRKSNEGKDAEAEAKRTVAEEEATKHFDLSLCFGGAVEHYKVLPGHSVSILKPTFGGTLKGINLEDFQYFIPSTGEYLLPGVPFKDAALKCKDRIIILPKLGRFLQLQKEVQTLSRGRINADVGAEVGLCVRNGGLNLAAIGKLMAENEKLKEEKRALEQQLAEMQKRLSEM